MRAQPHITDTNFNSWLTYIGGHRIKGNWELHLEEHWRRSDAGLNWQQNLFRPGVNYVLNERVTLSGGYAHILSWPYGDNRAGLKFPEHRIWQQVAVTQPVRRVRLLHRFRPEQRWLRTFDAAGDPSGWRYQNRLRYLGRVAIPLNNTWHLAAYDEIFINIAPNVGAHVFEQNRLYGAIGRKVGKTNSFELGYMYQLVRRRNGIVTEHNHTLQFTWFSRTSFTRQP